MCLGMPVEGRTVVVETNDVAPMFALDFSIVEHALDGTLGSPRRPPLHSGQ
jgi:hypothetical protein